MLFEGNILGRILFFKTNLFLVRCITDKWFVGWSDIWRQVSKIILFSLSSCTCVRICRLMGIDYLMKLLFLCKDAHQLNTNLMNIDIGRCAVIFESWRLWLDGWRICGCAVNAVSSLFPILRLVIKLRFSTIVAVQMVRPWTFSMKLWRQPGIYCEVSPYLEYSYGFEDDSCHTVWRSCLDRIAFLH